MPVQTPKAQEPVRIARDIEPQVMHDLGRDPSGAQLVPREACPVQNQDLGASLGQPVRRRRACRAAADDDDVGATHRAAYRAYMYSRVSGIALFSCLANST